MVLKCGPFGPSFSPKIGPNAMEINHNLSKPSTFSWVHTPQVRG